MTIKIYNTLTRKKEIFRPLEEGKVSMYVCGPTVYNYIHIGNARPAIVFDTVRRYLEYRGYQVNYVSNFTDVDDKLIHASKTLGERVPELAERFIAAYFSDIQALGCKRANLHPRVTENMTEIIAFIAALIEKGYAYESEGDVYYRTRKFETYGKLSKQSIDELNVGARIDVDEKKEDALDFALWKKAKPDEIYWESPWGNGRPGWHIECSAMVKKYLGDTIDIHAGGQDLSFPHHENEIAQSEALTGKPFANYWMHNGYINIDNEKMSKSLGNFITVHDIIREISPQLLRFFMLQVHYRNPINYSKEQLDLAKRAFDRLQSTVSNLKHRLQVTANLDEEITEWTEKLDAHRIEFQTVMDDDFNTANAITVLFELGKDANLYLAKENSNQKVIQAFLDLFSEFTDVLGLILDEENEGMLDAQVEALIAERKKARSIRDCARADEIRDQLKAMNIIIEDTAQGVRWKRG